MYIGAVAVLPTCVDPSVPLDLRGAIYLILGGEQNRLLEESKSGKQALREVRFFFGSG